MDADFPKELVPSIERFFKDDKEPEGQALYPNVFKEVFFPLQRQTELAHMINEARQLKPKVIYEIGADKGGGLYHWCKCLSPEHMIACEIRGTPYKHLFEKHFPNIHFTWIEGPSTIINPLIELPPIDILFIDGDKGAFDTDFYNCLPYMNRPSLVFMHDIQDEQPRSGFDKVAKHFKSEVYINIEDTRIALIREAAKLPPENAHEGWLRHWRGQSCGVGIIRL